MLSPRCLSATAILLAVSAAVSAPALAQTPPARFVPAPPHTLQDLLEKVVWDARQRGTLLIVAPEKTTAFQDREHPRGAGEPIISSPARIPPPDADGGYRLPNIGPFFGRRAQVVGRGLTVFAPTTMTVLSARLPKPDPYAGMGQAEKLRLFESTLTPAQWRVLGSPEGIGIGDLDRKQSDLFLSLLPSPFIVRPALRGSDGTRFQGYVTNVVPKDTVTLAPAQRQTVRLSLHRVLDWYFTDAAARSRTHIGFNHDDGASFELSGAGFGSNITDSDNELFGVPVLREVPNRRKPGQLPFDAAALDPPVSLDGAATVGDLIARAAAQTHLALLCDGRYARLSVYLRSSGGTVRAGDLLEALSLAVTGTFRKVGSGADAAFVLTDDLEGLGTRQARLQAWASANAALAWQRQNDAEASLAKAPIGEAVGWNERDPMLPGDALREKIEDYRKKTRDSADAPVKPLLVPVSELPASARATLKRQLESYARSEEQRKNDPFFAAHPQFYSAIQTDRVAMDVCLEASFVVPGMGSITAQGSSYSSDAAQHLVPATYRQARPAAKREPFPPLAIPASYRRRVLLFAPRNADEAMRGIAAAKAHGLNQVWIETVPGENGESGEADKTLAAAIAAGKKANIAVGASLRLLRIPGDTMLPRDRNIVGETTAEYAARRADTPFVETPFVRPTLTPRAEGERLRHWGDWLVPDDPSVAVSALKRAAIIAQTPGLAGIVLRDVAAPGYDGAASPLSSEPADGAEQMGYTEPMRLAFLRETGLDPIDLSPLRDGSLNLPPGGNNAPFIRLRQPFFDGDPLGSAGPGGSRAGAGSERWKQFRAGKSDQIVQTIVRAIHSRQPALPVWVRRGDDDFDGNPLSRFFDTGKAEPDPSAAARAAAAPNPNEGTALPHSPQALLLARHAPLSLETTPSDTPDRGADEFTRYLSSLLRSPQIGWSGIVIDLTETPTLDRALRTLDILRAAPSAPNK